MFFYILLFLCGYAQETPSEFFISGVDYLRSHLTHPPQNTSRFATTAMVVNHYLDQKIHPRDLEKYAKELKTVQGAAKVLKKFLGHGWYSNGLIRQEVWYLLSQKYPLVFEWNPENFVVLVGYDSHGFFVNDPDNIRKSYMYYDEIQFVSPFQYRVATGDTLRKVWIGNGNHF